MSSETVRAPDPALPVVHKERRRRAVVIVGAVLAVLLAAALWQRANPFTIETSVEIEASPAAVWEVLVDFPRYPEWNPTLVGMEGALVPGGTLRFATEAGDEALVFEPVVRELAENSLLS